MKKTKQIETLVMEKLAFLQERYGFMSPIVNQDRWCTTISYLAADIAIEIELDWRDLNMFVLVTKLENGRLPSGYYVSNGKISRMHLEKVLKGALGVNPEYIKKVLGFMPDHRKRGPSTFEKRLDAYLVLIRDHITAICEKGARLFDQGSVNITKLCLKAPSQQWGMKGTVGMIEFNMVLRRTPHALYDTKYHLVWTPKYRRWIDRKDIRSRIEEIFKEIASNHQMEIDRMEVE